MRHSYKGKIIAQGLFPVTWILASWWKVFFILSSITRPKRGEPLFGSLVGYLLPTIISKWDMLLPQTTQFRSPNWLKQDFAMWITEYYFWQTSVDIYSKWIILRSYEDATYDALSSRKRPVLNPSFPTTSTWSFTKRLHW